MPLPAFLEKLFGRAEASKDAAKNRLKLVLMHDRAAIPAAVLEQMRSELLAVLSKYVEIDQQSLEVNLERSEGTIALLANVPILRVREGHGTDAPTPEAMGSGTPGATPVEAEPHVVPAVDTPAEPAADVASAASGSAASTEASADAAPSEPAEAALA